MGERKPQSTDALERGERVVDLLGVHGRHAVRRWRVDTADVHTDHHVMLGRLPDDYPDGRWYVDSTYWQHRRAWAYPAASGAMWRVDQMRAARLDWEWTEVPPTPYDTELGRVPDGEQ